MGFWADGVANSTSHHLRILVSKIIGEIGWNWMTSTVTSSSVGCISRRSSLWMDHTSMLIDDKSSPGTLRSDCSSVLLLAVDSPDVYPLGTIFGCCGKRVHIQPGDIKGGGCYSMQPSIHRHSPERCRAALDSCNARVRRLIGGFPNLAYWNKFGR